MDEIKQIVKNSEPQVITSLNGEQLELPKLTLLHELKIMNRFAEILDMAEVQEIRYGLLFKAIFKNDDTIDKFLEILEIFTGKSKEFIGQNFDIKGVISALLPFFVANIKEIAQMITEATKRVGDVNNIATKQTH